MQIVQVAVGPLATNCYLVKEPDSPETLVVDPGAEPEAILAVVREVEGRVVGLFCTHGHPDHVGALRALIEATRAPVYLHPAELGSLRRAWPEFGVMEPPLEAGTLRRERREGDVLEVGALRFRVLHTPGHTPGALCLVGEEVAFTGDTLFAGGVGRTDLPGGDEAALTASLERLSRELSPITLIYPGHGDTTVFAQELSANPWLVALAKRP